MEGEESAMNDLPRTILKHRARRDSEAERLLAASMVYARDEMIRRARTADGYLGPEPDISDRVARLPPEVAQHLVPGGSAAAALVAHGIVDPYAALGRVFDAAKGEPSAHLVAVEIIEFGVVGAITRASE